MIHAPIERCWTLSIRIEVVQKTLGMKPLSGVTRGSIFNGARVEWRGWKFGLPTVHHTLITRFEPPHHHYIKFDGDEMTKEAFFQDTQERGRFASFQHDHYFREENGVHGLHTILDDEVRYELPFGAVGKVVARRVVGPYIQRLARERFVMIKALCESEGWREWVDDTSTA